MSWQNKSRIPRGVLVGITGASGIRYAIRLIEVLRENNLLAAVIYSRAAAQVAAHEEGLNLEEYLRNSAGNVYRDDDFGAPYASSSSAPESMIIIPCSMNTLAKIAHGIQDNLITRAASSMLRLRRKLILVIRETPLGPIEIRNMLIASLAGAVILPAAPGFYSRPKTLNDIVDFIVGKVLDVLGVEHNLYRRWGSN